MYGLMDCLLEFICECLSEIPFFNAQRHKPFGLIYWLGWLGVLLSVCFFCLLAVGSFFGVGWLLGEQSLTAFLVVLVLVGSSCFWAWKSYKAMGGMVGKTIFYRRMKNQPLD